jgi:excisionase family DNA binding protein
MENPFLTINEVARYLNVKASTLYAKVHEIPHYKVGRLLRFKLEDVDRWMESNRKDDTAPQRKRPEVKTHKRGNAEGANEIVRKAIDEVRGSGYTSQRGKSDRIKGLGKE